MPHITDFLLKGEDYFIARLDNGGVRIGMAGCYSTDFPENHEMFSVVVDCARDADIVELERLSDEIYSIHLQGGDCRILLIS